MKASHKIRIHEYLKENGSITPMEALSEFGCYRLSARIYDLRKDGVNIRKDIVATVSKPSLIRRMKGEKPESVTYARYSLVS